MSNYKSNDNSTENTTLREWWGIVRAEFSRVFEILNEAVGEFTADGGIIFGKESKAALSPNAVAMGPNCTAGGKGFAIIGQQPLAPELQLQHSFEGSSTQNIPAKYNDNTTVVVVELLEGWDNSLSVNNSFVDDTIDIDVSNLTINDTISISIHKSGTIYKVEYYENAPISLGTYTLSSVEGLEVGMRYSVKLSTAQYNAGTITAINGNDVTVDNYTYIEPHTEEEIASATSAYFRTNYLTIVGRPEIGDMEVGYNAIALGEDCVAQDRCSFSAGYNNKSIGQFSATLGMDNIAGYGSFVCGRGNEGNGTADIIGGQENIVNGSYNEVSGMYNNVIGGKNEVNGGDHTVNGDYNSVGGQQNTITGNRNDVSGYKNTITTSLASVRGSKNTVTAENGDAQGMETTVSGYAGHTEGGKTKSSGNYSHARNYNTKANGVRSTAGGFNSEANGDTSTAIGKATIANGDNQVTIGQYNKADTTSAFIVGNGSSKGRSNAYTLDWDGNGTFAGDVKINGETSVGEAVAKVDEFIKPISTYKNITDEVKCHVGDKVPIGERVILKSMHTPSGDVITVGSATGDIIDVVMDGGSSTMIFNGDEITSDKQGSLISAIRANSIGYTCYSYDEGCYAVFEVTANREEIVDTLCITSPNGTVYKLTVDDDGNLSVVNASLVVESETVIVSYNNPLTCDFSEWEKVCITNNSDSVYVAIFNADGTYMNYINPGAEVILTGDELASVFTINTDPDTGEAEITIVKEKTL